MSKKICERLLELAKAVTQGPDSVRREFTMSVPVQLERDADIVLSAAADAIAALESESAQYREAAEKEEKECERLRLINEYMADKLTRIVVACGVFPPTDVLVRIKGIALEQLTAIAAGAKE